MGNCIELSWNFQGNTIYMKFTMELTWNCHLLMVFESCVNIYIHIYMNILSEHKSQWNVKTWIDSGVDFHLSKF